MSKAHWPTEMWLLSLKNIELDLNKLQFVNFILEGKIFSLIVDRKTQLLVINKVWFWKLIDTHKSAYVSMFREYV